MSPDFAFIQEWVKDLHKRLTDKQQGGGCPDLSEDGKKWRYSFMPKGIMYMDVDQIQALFRIFNLPELTPIKSNGSCKDCVHGRGVSSETGLWPIIDDCSGCKDPTHQHFIHHTLCHEFNSIEPAEILNIPAGGSIDIYKERVRKGMEGPVKYVETSDFIVRCEDDLRICKTSSLGQLHIPGHRRDRDYRRVSKLKKQFTRR